MCEYFVCMYTCVQHVSNASEDHKGVLDSHETGVIVSCEGWELYLWPLGEQSVFLTFSPAPRL